MIAKRSQLESKIIILLKSLFYAQYGRTAFSHERFKIGEREVNIFGFRTSLEMTNEELSNFEIFLKSRVKAETNRKALPGPFKI